MELVKKNRLRVFYGAYFLYLFATVLQWTMFIQYEALTNILKYMRYLAFAMALVKIVLDLLAQWEREKQYVGKTKIWRIPICQNVFRYALILLIVGIGAFYTGDRSLLFVAALLLAAKDAGTEEVFRKTLICQAVLLALVVFSSSLDIIPDLLFTRKSVPIRHALGYIYPSVMVTYFFFILLLYFWLIDRPVTWKELLAVETVNFLIYLLTDCRTGFLMIAVTALAMYLSGWAGLRRLKSAISGKKVWDKLLRHFYDYAAVYLSLLLFLLCLGYSFGGIEKIDSLLSGRVRLTTAAVRDYGVHLFGSRIEWVGFGATVSGGELSKEYNFVDSSYGYILLNYGILIFAAALWLMVRTGKRVRKRESPRRQFIFLMVLLYCFIEPRLLELQINTFLFLSVPALTKSVIQPHRPSA